MTQKKVYDKEFKIQAVKLGMEIGFSKAAKALGSISTPSTDGIVAPKMPYWIWGQELRHRILPWALPRKCRSSVSRTGNR